MRDFDPTASEYITSGFIARSKPGGALYDPTTIALAGVGSSLLGGVMGADAAGDAANAQREAAAASDATQRYFYDTTRADNAPFRDTGVQANNRLAYLMGLGGGSGGAPQTADQIRNQLLAQYTKSSGGGQPTYDPNSNYESGVGYANGMQIPTGYSQGTSTVDEAGLKAAIDQRLQQQAAQQGAQANDPAYGSLMRNFSTADLNADPVYQSGLQFGLNEGTKGINRQAAAGGSMLSGATLKALTRFGNDYGSTKANESYNRFNNNNTQQYNRLAGLSGAGQQATNQVSAAGQNAGNNISASQQGAGNARASGYVGSANAISGGLSGAYNGYQQNQLMSKLFSSGSGYNGTSGYTGGADPLGNFITANGY